MESYENDILRQEELEELDRQAFESEKELFTTYLTDGIADANQKNFEEQDILECFVEAFKEMCPDSRIKLEIK